MTVTKEEVMTIRNAVRNFRVNKPLDNFTHRIVTCDEITEPILQKKT